MAQQAKNLPAVQEMWVQSLGEEDHLEEEMATHSSIRAWDIPWTEGPARLQTNGSQRFGYDWAQAQTEDVSNLGDCAFQRSFGNASNNTFFSLYWSGLPFPSPGDLPNPGIKPGSPALEADTLTSEPPGKEIESKYLTMHQTASNTELYDMKFSSYWSWKKQRFKKDVSYDMLPEPNPQKHWRSHFRFFLFSLSTYTWLDSDFYFRDHGLS